MNARERESLLKTFGLSFLSLFLVTLLALIFYHREQVRFYQDRILAEMVTFSYSLEGGVFDVDFVAPAAGERLGRLEVGDGEVYALFALNDSERRLKVIYPFEGYREGISRQYFKSGMILLAALVTLLLFSLFFARYALHPLRDALRLMEEFLKDIIHDLNTPVTAIILNAQLLRRRHEDAEIRRIETSARTIGSLYKNLEVLNRELPVERTEVELQGFFEERLEYYRTLFPSLNFSLEGGRCVRTLNREAFVRIIDNILSNACKYNVPGGSVAVSWDETEVRVRDTGIGIKDPQRVFERFYKESERGLGLGLNIVKKLSEEAGLAVELHSLKGSGTTVTLRFVG